MDLISASLDVIVDGIAAIMNPALAPPTLSATADQEPNVTARLRQLLQASRAGKLSPDECAYRWPGLVDTLNKSHPERLAKLGDETRVQLVNREERGDDRVYTYDIEFATKTIRLTITLIPDGRVTEYWWREK